jgi:hypothetical protein
MVSELMNISDEIRHVSITFCKIKLGEHMMDLYVKVISLGDSGGIDIMVACVLCEILDCLYMVLQVMSACDS